MNLILEKAALYGFNSRALTERDFYSICERERIGVEWVNEEVSWYMTLNYRPYIVLPKCIYGLPLLFKQFHELGHHIAHHGLEPDVAFFHGDEDTKAELEADALALIALIPLKDLRSPRLDDSRYARQIVNERRRLYFLYGV